MQTFPLQQSRFGARSGPMVPFPTTAGRGWTTIIKTADETQNNATIPGGTTLRADAQLRVPLVGGHRYRIRARLYLGALVNGTPDFNTTWRLIDAAGTIVADNFTLFLAQTLLTPNANTLTIVGPTTMSPAPHTASPTVGANTKGNTSSDEYNYVRWDLIVESPITTTLALCWNQDTASVFFTVCSRGSAIEYIEV